MTDYFTAEHPTGHALKLRYAVENVERYTVAALCKELLEAATKIDALASEVMALTDELNDTITTRATEAEEDEMLEEELGGVLLDMSRHILSTT